VLQQIILPKYNSKMEEQLINLFHETDLPLHFNKTGNKEFTNYQRVSIIILFYKSKKSLRDFVVDFQESKWISWLGLQKIPRKSTLHDLLKMFDMKTVRKICKVLRPKNVELTSIDGTGFDAWQRSRHYEKRAEEIEPLPPMPYAKAGIFIDVKTQIIAEKIFKRNDIENIKGLGDKGFDSEHLHEVARANGITFYAPIRKMNKRACKNKRPSGFYQRQCVNLPSFKGMRSINETVNSVLKRTQIHSLRSKKHFMREREFARQIVYYNIKRIIKISDSNDNRAFFICQIEIYSIRTEPILHFLGRLSL